MSARALTKLGRSADIPQDQRDHLFRFSSNDAYPPFPLWQVFHPAFWKANYANGAIFKDKVVIVGASSQIRHDFIVTPLNPATPGPAVHLQVMAATEAHEFLRQTPTRVMLGTRSARGDNWVGLDSLFAASNPFSFLAHRNHRDLSGNCPSGLRSLRFPSRIGARALDSSALRRQHPRDRLRD